MSMSIDFLPPLAEIRADFLALGVSIQSFRVPLERAVRQVLVPSIEQNFAEEGRPGWEPLAPATVTQRGSSEPILVRTGALLSAATQLNAWTYTREDASYNVPDKAYYGAILQAGWVFGPARPFALVQDEDVTAIEEIFGNWLDERLAAVGWVMA